MHHNNVKHRIPLIVSRSWCLQFLTLTLTDCPLGVTSEDQKILRRKYKINEDDLDQIPGKNRKRKKKRPAPGVREGPSGRSAGSGPKVKTLGLDSYDSSICAICLTPMQSVLQHSLSRPAVPTVTPPQDLGSALDSILRSIPSSVLYPVPVAGAHTEQLTAAETHSDSTTSAPINGDTTNRFTESNRMAVVDLSEDNVTSDPSNSLSRTQDPHLDPSSTSVEEDKNAANLSQLVIFNGTQPSSVPTRPTVDPDVPKYFHRLTCSDCGIHVHLGCVCDTEGATAVASHMLKGTHCVMLHCNTALL